MHLPRRAPYLAALLIAALPLVAPAARAAERGDDSQRKSKNGRTEGTVAGVQVRLDYGRPAVQGRAIFGALVPYGKVWRTGADEATTITFGRDVAIEGQRLAAGTYALFTIPGADEWTVIFNRTAQQWGAFKYQEAEDALRVKVKPGTTEAVEQLDFVLDGDRVVLRWEKVAVGFRVAPAS